MAEAVREQVLDHLLEAVRIAEHLIGTRVDVDRDRHAAPLEFRLMAPEDVLEQAARRKDAALELDDAVFEA